MCQLLINLHLIHFNFVSLNVMVNIFFWPFFCRPTDTTLANLIEEKHKNKWGMAL